MGFNDYNNDFLSYQGTISRKNYAINMLILAALYIVISLVRFDVLLQFITFKFLYWILMFMVGLVKFVILMSALSVVYRRFADISKFKTYNFNINMKRLFVFLFVLPVLYLFCIRYFLDFMPFLINILDLVTFFVLMPLGLITALVLCFIKGN